MKKIKFYLAMGLMTVGANYAQAQTARVQVIHNSPDLAAATVDVYLNGAILLDDFKFRTASPFVNAPAGTPLLIQVKGSTSTAATPALYSITPTLTAGEKYILVANGIVSPTGYSPIKTFEISVKAMGREVATVATNTDVLVVHGSPDAPTVDVVETSALPITTIVNNVSYPQFSNYLQLPTANYSLDVTDETGNTVVASYSAPLADLDLQGQAITVLASGFLIPDNNSEGPEFGLWVATAAGGNLIALPVDSPTARVQVIHNSPDLAAATVDIYLNGAILLDDFAFRTATPFIDAPAGTPITIEVKGNTSTPATTPLYTTSPTLIAGEKYILVANGIVSATGYSPSKPFEISVKAMAREAATVATNTDVLVLHGSPDAPTVDVIETSGNPDATIVNDISFPEFSNYLQLPTANYTLDVTPAAGTPVVASYSAPLADLNLQGQAITVLASGFLIPGNNSNGPAFGLWAALSSGGALVKLPTAVLSVNSFASENIALYPNPASKSINLDITNRFDNASFSVIDMGGREIIKSTSFKGGQIDVSGVSNGLYMINLTVDNKNLTQKFFVNK